MNLDIKTAVQTAFVLSIVGLILGLLLGFRNIRAGRKLLYFRKRQDLMMRGWRLVFVAMFFGAMAFMLDRYAEPAVYLVFPPSPTVTLTPTITMTQTITLTPTISLTPSITPTPAISNTPDMPEWLATEFTGLVTPNPDSIFSVPVFAQGIDDDFQPMDPQSEFDNPVGRLYAAFSYDQMVVESQWSAIWYRVEDREIICYETKPWDGSTGGYGYTECDPPAGDWIPGEYETQIFVGMEWMVSNRFTVIGEPPTPTITRTSTSTITSTRTLTPTRTATPTYTASPTVTQSSTMTKTATRTPTRTPTKTSTVIPTFTSTITRTPTSTTTSTPTIGPSLSATYRPTRTRTAPPPPH